MNNLFKIFLLINLIPSATSSVNNYSLPLPETELKMGQNSSELVERAEPITLLGGTTVQGITIEGGVPTQRPCTLSFPVIKYGRYKGFLTSLSCTNTDIFVEDTKVGEVGAPAVFAPERGLDYVFIDVYPEYWSTKVSENMLYSPQCEENESLPIIPIADQSLSPNFTVCAFGGLKGEMACGEILEFDVTIQVPKPGTDGKEFVDFVK